MEFPPDVLAAAEDLIPQMGKEPGATMRSSMVWYAAKAMMQERALFAPILEEKERLERNRDMWKGQCERQAEALRQNAIAFQGKCLDLDAAEAALAAERAMLKRIVDLHADWRLCMPKDWEGDPLSDACEDAAAAIRARGE